MKTIKLLMISLICSLFIFKWINAESNNLKFKLYKQIALSSKQIINDYWKKVNNKITKIFIKYRYTENKIILNKINKKLKKILSKIDKNAVLSRKQKKKINLFKNILYRSEVLLRYNLR